LLVGAILVSGSSVGGSLRATGGAVAETTSVVRALGRRRRGAGEQDTAPEGFDLNEFAEDAFMKPPDPQAHELVVRATHVEGPAQEQHGQEAAAEPDFEGETPIAEPPVGEAAEEEEVTGVARTDATELTPQGRLRDAVTDDPDFVWE